MTMLDVYAWCREAHTDVMVHSFNEPVYTPSAFAHEMLRLIVLDNKLSIGCPCC